MAGDGSLHRRLKAWPDGHPESLGLGYGRRDGPGAAIGPGTATEGRNGKRNQTGTRTSFGPSRGDVEGSTSRTRPLARILPAIAAASKTIGSLSRTLIMFPCFTRHHHLPPSHHLQIVARSGTPSWSVLSHSRVGAIPARHLVSRLDCGIQVPHSQ